MVLGRDTTLGLERCTVLGPTIRAVATGNTQMDLVNSRGINQVVPPQVLILLLAG